MAAYDDYQIAMQEMLGLLTEPDWAQDDVILERLYGPSKDPTNPAADSVIGRLEASSGQLGQAPKLTTDAQGNVTIDRDAQGNIIYESADEQYAGLLQQFEQSRLDSISANEDRYNQLLSGYADRTQGLMQGTGPSTYGVDFTGVFDPYQSTMNTVSGDYATAATDLGTDLGAVTSAYDQRATDIENLFDTYGTQAAEDISNVYSQRFGGLAQDMASRGLANTTVTDNKQMGLAEQEARDQRRLTQDLNRERLGLKMQLGADHLNAQERQALQQHQAAMQQLQGQSIAAQGIAGMGMQGLGLATQLSQEPLGAIERRTDVAPSLSDVANLSSVYGRATAPNTFSLGSFTPTSYFQQTSQQQAPAFGG